DDGSKTGGQLDAIANDEVQYFAKFSTTGGIQWSRDIQVSDGFSSAFDPSGGDPATRVHYGEYTGLAFVDGVIHMTWTDNSNSTKNNPGPPTPTGPLLPAGAAGVASLRQTDAYYDSIRVGSPTVLTISADAAPLLKFANLKSSDIVAALEE